MENEAIQSQQNVTPAREIGIITAEIREICRQARNMALMYAIEIGRRLVEAKSALDHGQWGEWLKNEVEFSQSSANNFMRLYEEYGSAQISIFGASANSQTIANLPYSKALQLLSLPADERWSFAEEEDIEHMSVRDLQTAIRERNEALEAAEEARRQRDELEERAERAERSAENARRSAEALDELKARLGQLQSEKAAAEEKAKKAREKLKAAKENPEIAPDVMDRIKAEAHESALVEAEKKAGAEIEAAKQSVRNAEERLSRAVAQREEYARELEDARRRLKTANPDVTAFKTLFDEMQSTAAKLKEKIGAISEHDAETAERLRAALSAFGQTL